MKKRNFKTTKMFCCGIILLFIAVIVSKKDVVAATPGVDTLQMDKTYGSYDINGDKKKDTIKFTAVTNASGAHTGMALYVNNKKIYSLPVSMGVAGSVQVITLKNGQVFLHIWTNEGMYKKSRLIQYKGGKVKLISDFSSMPKKYVSYSYVYTLEGPGITVSGNSVTVKVKACTWTAGVQFLMFKYNYKNGTLKRAATTGNVLPPDPSMKKVTAVRAFPAYKKVNNKQKAFTVKKNKKVQLTKYYYNGKVLWMQVKNSDGKTGWIPGLTQSNYETKRMFSGIAFSS